MLRLYMDHHVPTAITKGLRGRGVDVLTALEDHHADTEDESLLARDTELDRVVFTRDQDFLMLGCKAQESGLRFSGVVYGHQLHVTIGEAIRDLDLICQVLSPDEIQSQIVFLPL